MDSALLEALLRRATEELIKACKPVRWLDMEGRCLAPAACWASEEGIACAGEAGMSFTLMSAIKPFLLLHLLQTAGEAAVNAWVDDRASDQPYWSLDELLADGGRPRNAMINSGAMLLASKLAGGPPAAQQAVFQTWLRQFCPGVELTLHEACFADVMAPGADEHNMDLARALAGTGAVADPRAAYETYFRLCCLAGTVEDVARLGLALSRTAGKEGLRVLQTITKAGLYEASAAWQAGGGMPAKSGVSGIVFGIWPGVGCLAACDQWLDATGGAIVPQKVLLAAAKLQPPARVQG